MIRGRSIAVALAVIGAAVLVVVSAYTIGYTRGGGTVVGIGEVAPEATTGEGASPEGQAFAKACGSCHVLKAAGTSGTVGPDLDTTKLQANAVLKQIKNGGATMPAGLLQGPEAKSVAEYVAKVAGSAK